MSNNVRNAVSVALGLTAFMAILPPALVAGTDGAVWAFVEKFQTLISGILAVAAAVTTIHQMHVTDKNSERRHADLLELSLRPDRLKVKRMMYPWGVGLAKYIAATKAVVPTLTSSTPEEERRIKILRVWGELDLRLKEAMSFLDEPDFIEARNLYSPEVAYRLWSIKQNSELLRRSVSDLQRMTLEINGKEVPIATEASQLLEDVFSDFDELHAALREMAREYGVLVREA